MRPGGIRNLAYRFRDECLTAYIVIDLLRPIFKPVCAVVLAIVSKAQTA